MSNSAYPPGPAGLPLVGNTFAFRRDPLGFLLKTSRDFGDIAYVPVLFGHGVYLLTNPDHIRHLLVENHRNFVKSSDYESLKLLLGEGLLTSEGEVHKRQRRMAQPAFHKSRIAGYAEIMTENALQMCGRWRDGETLDAHQEMTKVTLRIVARTLFSADVEKEAARIGDAVSALMPLFDHPVMILAPRLFAMLPQFRRRLKYRQTLDATVYAMIEEHRQAGGEHQDLMSMLLQAQDQEDSRCCMTDREVRDQVMTLFLAGHETTANALTWTWYLLSQHAEVESRLHAEIDSVLEGRRPAVDDLPNLPYLRMVLAESMRLFPPAWAIGRRALADFRLDGYTIPAGSDVLMSSYVVHHDLRFFPDPFKFDPGRWTPEAEAARPAFSYFPFGGGPRACIGESFAKMEAALLLATIAQRWRLRLVPGHRVEPLALVTLRPRFGLRVTVERRPVATEN
jgi:cytochrome P450